MSKKRLKRIAAVVAASDLPIIENYKDGWPVIISWGSTLATIKEAIQILTMKDDRFKALGLLHLEQLWPLPENHFTKILKDAGMLIAIENSVCCTIADWIKEVSGRTVGARITRLDGRPFGVDELVRKIQEAIVGGDSK